MSPAWVKKNLPALWGSGNQGDKKGSSPLANGFMDGKVSVAEEGKRDGIGFLEKGHFIGGVSGTNTDESDFFYP